MSSKPTATKEKKKLEIRPGVFFVGIAIFAAAAIWGIVDNASMISVTWSLFETIIANFAWLYQIVCVLCIAICLALCFSKVGDIRFGGPHAKPKFSFATWFAMALTGGVAVGIVTYGVNYPVMFYGNVWGVLDGVGIEPYTQEAANFAMARSFHEWTFIPYAFYAVSGALIAYLYYNKGKKLSVSASIAPVLGDKLMQKNWIITLVDILGMAALGFGLTSGLALLLSTIGEGFAIYGLSTDLTFFIVAGLVITGLFSVSSYVGLDKGLKRVASANIWLYYGFMLFLVITGSALMMLNNTVSGMGVWLDNFASWTLDAGSICGEGLVYYWTVINWCMWIAYAPITGVLLAMISRGRTLRQFMIVNWILPCIFSIVWFGIWGNAGLEMQMAGTVDLVAVMTERGLTSAMWTFLANLPFGVGTILVPVNLLVLVISFVTAADAGITNIGSICVKNVPVGTEPPAKVKVIWGIVIGIVAVIMGAFGGGSSGLDGVKSLATIGGFLVLFVFLIQIVACIKVFFGKKTKDVYVRLENDYTDEEVAAMNREEEE